MPQKTRKTLWMIRATRNRTHKDVGRTLGLDGMANPEQLHTEMKTSDGVWNLWDCGNRSFATAKALILDFLENKQEVFLYKWERDKVPVRYEDDDIKHAREGLQFIEARSSEAE